MSVYNPSVILYDVNGNLIGVANNPLSVQTTGSVSLSSTVQSGSTTPGFPLLVGGADANGILRGLQTDAAGKLNVNASTSGGVSVYTQGPQLVTGSVAVYTQGPQAVSGTVTAVGLVQSGSTAQNNPVFVAGADSNNIIRGFLLDSSGRMINVGTVQTGSTAQGNPVIVGSIDSSGIVRGFSLDSTGRLNVNISSGSSTVVVGAAVSGSTVQGAPVFVGGADSAGIARALRTNVSGSLTVVGTVASGSTANNDAPLLVAGVDANGIVRTLKTDAAGRVVTDQVSTTGTQTSVVASATNVTLLAANTSRLGATIFNDSTSTCFVKLGSTASTTSYAAQLSSKGYYEIPYGYTGQIDAIWNNAIGNARITEMT